MSTVTQGERRAQRAYGGTGYLVLALDYFEGDPVQNHLHKVGQNYRIEFDFVPGKMIRAKQITPDWVEAVREQFGGFRIA